MMPQGSECPRCHDHNVTKPTFTWWGGVLGPKIIDHVKCARCGFAFNPRTGQPITSAIVIYCVVVGVIAALLMFAVFKGMH